MSPELSIVAPAYDEEECIEAVVRSWLEMIAEHRLDAEIVIADDGSRDRTPQILAALAARFPSLRPLRLPGNGGYGRAVAAGVAAARAPWIVTIDSDGQFEPRDIPRLLAERDRRGLDLLTGFRSAKNDSPARVLADRALRLYVRGLFGIRLRDTNCALKLIRAEWLKRQPLWAEGYSIPTEIHARAKADGLRVGEIEVDHLERVGGESKLRVMRTSLQMITFLARLRLALRSGSSGR
ncbi:MAG: glycosyltransferase family 2 protein [Myxococcales bacterium]|nr:glycosyltransferase family 2 protein [Myxococcales bacterium]